MEVYRHWTIVLCMLLCIDDSIILIFGFKVQFLIYFSLFHTSLFYFGLILNQVFVIIFLFYKLTVWLPVCCRLYRYCWRQHFWTFQLFIIIYTSLLHYYLFEIDVLFLCLLLKLPLTVKMLIKYLVWICLVVTI